MNRIAAAIAAATATIVLAATLSACGGNGEPEPTSTAEDFAARVLETREEAAQEGASDAQLAIIDEAAATGEITMEQVLTARDAFAQCLAAGGFTLNDLGVTDRQGYPYPDYNIAVPAEGENDQLMDECNSTHFFYVDMLYQTQPSSKAGGDAQFVAAMPTLIACLNDGGLTVEPDVTADELKEIMMEDIHANISDDPNQVPTDREMLIWTCMDQAGINGF